MIFAAAQFLFEGYAAGNFRTESAIDPNDHGQYGAQQQHGRQAVKQQVGPEGAVIGKAADPMLLDGVGFLRAEVGEHLVQDTHQHFIVTRYAHRQLVAVGRFATDV